jgi:NCAIR mutase (PurE)-related protein
MDTDRLRKLLEDVNSGKVGVDAALEKLRKLPFENVSDFAVLDNHRALRRGFPEVILAEGKSPEQVVSIFQRLASHNDKVLATRVSQEMYQAIAAQLPEATYHPVSRMLTLSRSQEEKKPGILVVTGGTSDIPVAEEAAITAELMGNDVECLFDVGVAGLHRLLSRQEQILKARVIIAVAGMEGALASVVAGLVSVPVIAVPTSVGYGTSFHGLAALLTMLNSCANGIAVVNIVIVFRVSVGICFFPLCWTPGSHLSICKASFNSSTCQSPFTSPSRRSTKGPWLPPRLR